MPRYIWPCAVAYIHLTKSTAVATFILFELCFVSGMWTLVCIIFFMYMVPLVAILHWTVRWCLLEDCCCLSYVLSWSKYGVFMDRPFPVNAPSLSAVVHTVRLFFLSECSKFIRRCLYGFVLFFVNAPSLSAVASTVSSFFCECSRFLSTLALRLIPSCEYLVFV